MNVSLLLKCIWMRAFWEPEHGRSKKEAEQQAAAGALSKLNVTVQR